MFFLLTILFFLGLTTASAYPPPKSSAPRPKISMGYVDLGYLRDTLPSPFYNDEDFTPTGRHHWDTEAYLQRISQTASLIDSLHLDMIAVWGVENEQVVRDLASHLKGDYSYLHHTLNSFDGRDFALLYYGDKWMVEGDKTGREMLILYGELRHKSNEEGESIALILSRDERHIASEIRSIRADYPERKIILMGRISPRSIRGLGLQDCMAHEERMGRGNRLGRHGWEMRDRIYTDTALNAVQGRVYISSYLLDMMQGSLQHRQYMGVEEGNLLRALPIFLDFN